MTAAQKTLAKVDKTGMKPMSSFFSPKVKVEKKWMLYSLWLVHDTFCNKNMWKIFILSHLSGGR